MKSRLMKSISEITFSDSNDSDTKRENANIDGNTAMGTMLQYGSAVSKEFCMSQVMNPEHVMLHDQGDIHVHDMDFMNMGTLTCCQIDLSKLYNITLNYGEDYGKELEISSDVYLINSNLNIYYLYRKKAHYDNWRKSTRIT